jgi:hypothetical protein
MRVPKKDSVPFETRASPAQDQNSHALEVPHYHVQLVFIANTQHSFGQNQTWGCNQTRHLLH